MTLSLGRGPQGKLRQYSRAFKEEISISSHLAECRGKISALPLSCSFSYCRHVSLNEMNLSIKEAAEHLKNTLSSI